MFLPGQDDIESLQELLSINLPTVQHTRAMNQIENNTNPIVNSTTSAIAGSDINNNSSNIDKDSKTNEDINRIVEFEEDFVILPLYAAMPPDEQMKVFAETKPNVRKFVLATNIAETSVTIPGIKYGAIFELLLLFIFTINIYSQWSTLALRKCDFCILSRESKC